MPNHTLTTDAAGSKPVQVEALPRGGSHSIDTIRAAVHEARAALAATLNAAGVDPTKTRESARLLNINRGLIWRISRVVGAEDDVTAATHLPGQVGLERLIDACRARGVSEQLLSETRAAIRAFHDVVDRLSGDRRTLEILLANASTQSTSVDLTAARRAMFEGGCAVWGVRAEVRLRSLFLTPNPDDPSMIDDSGIAGYIGFRRLRQVPWPMSYKAVYHDSGAADAPREELIDTGEPANGGLALLREFCSPRDLSLEMVKTSRATRHELPVNPDAPADPVTCVFGSIYRRIYTRVQTPDCKMAGSILVMDTPVERVVLDTFVHRSLGMAEPPEVALLDRLTRPHGFSGDEYASEILPIEVTPRRLGPGSAGAVSPHVPWYPRFIEAMCKRLGFRSDEFIAHRVEMVYPPIPTALLARFTLPVRSE